jgi:hypothetical protein
LNPNILTTCARGNSKKKTFFFFFNDHRGMSNNDVEDQDIEELSNKDEIAKKKRGQVCCALKFCPIS